ncbi:MAG: NYN domain-containing protein [Candidatus Krumholzibacteriota bacterium]|nr:NYN domain-containing protein [Candidatus Krumholzibacteriota bacterium]
MNEPSIAVFIDFENLAIGVQSLKGANTFKIDLVLKRLLGKGRVVYKRAYSDWMKYRGEMKEFHAEGVELIDIPQSKMSGKNSADIRMVVDAIDLCHIKGNIDIFALVSGDSDFSPLVAKLKENNKRVIGCGIRSSTSQLLVNNCDEFIYYDDLVRELRAQPRSAAQGKPADRAAKPRATRQRKTKAKTKSAPASDAAPPADAAGAPAEAIAPENGEHADVFNKILEVIRSLQDDYDPLWGSLVKQTVRRVHPGFREKHYGFSGFNEMLEEMQERGYLELEYDQSRGNFKVVLVGH